LIAGVFFGFQLYLSQYNKGHIVRGVKVGGLALGAMARGEAMQTLKTRLGPRGFLPVSLTRGEQTWRIKPSSVGIGIDLKNTILRAEQAGREGGPIKQIRDRARVSRGGIDLPVAFVTDGALWDEFCLALEKEVTTDPVNTHLSVDRNGALTATPGQYGQKLDRRALRNLLQRSYLTGGNRKYQLPVASIKPELSPEEVAKWPLDQVLGVYTTPFNAWQPTRSHNLRMATAAIDGVIVLSKQDFSFNGRIGPRIPKSGYLEAPVISGQKLVLGVGGGVCQVSTTLFNAALLANLPIRTRWNHSLPSAYVPLGRDATVTYGGADLAFGNDTGGPVVVCAAIDGSRLTVAVVGHRDVSPKIDFKVEIIKITPFETLTANDPGLPSGTVSVQEGKKGYRVALWRTATWPDGRIVRERIAESFYPPVAKIVKQGVGSPRLGKEWPPRPSPNPTPSPSPGSGP
jgi:vancomycin resistance protein YoaR